MVPIFREIVAIFSFRESCISGKLYLERLSRYLVFGIMTFRLIAPLSKFRDFDILEKCMSTSKSKSLAEAVNVTKRRSFTASRDRFREELLRLLCIGR